MVCEDSRDRIAFTENKGGSDHVFYWESDQYRGNDLKIQVHKIFYLLSHNKEAGEYLII